MEPTSPVLTIFATVILPPLIAILKQTGWSPQVNGLIALATYAVIGVAAAYLELGVPLLSDPLQVITWIAAVGVQGTVAYKLFWSNLGRTTETTPSIEERLTAATSVVR
jgi:hypothetical protein